VQAAKNCSLELNGQGHVTTILVTPRAHHNTFLRDTSISDH